MEKNKLIGMKISEVEYNRLKDIAKSMNLDVSKLIRRSIQPYLDNNKGLIAYYDRLQEITNGVGLIVSEIDNIEKTILKTLGDSQNSK